MARLASDSGLGAAGNGPSCALRCLPRATPSCWSRSCLVIGIQRDHGFVRLQQLDLPAIDTLVLVAVLNIGVPVIRQDEAGQKSAAHLPTWLILDQLSEGDGLLLLVLLHRTLHFRHLLQEFGAVAVDIELCPSLQFLEYRLDLVLPSANIRIELRELFLVGVAGVLAQLLKVLADGTLVFQLRFLDHVLKSHDLFSLLLLPSFLLVHRILQGSDELHGRHLSCARVAALVITALLHWRRRHRRSLARLGLPLESRFHLAAFCGSGAEEVLKLEPRRTETSPLCLVASTVFELLRHAQEHGVNWIPDREHWGCVG
mmetsp:Transcript_10020/g.22427  ORF Transcript_10020/g.22427 Transcript_10020/m.22427 type:complete len:315 (+) Transcript_10020:166-1110(+)